LLQLEKFAHPRLRASPIELPRQPLAGDGPNHRSLLKLSMVAWALSIALRTDPGENSKYDFSIEK
jgi:hypothetical protein